MTETYKALQAALEGIVLALQQGETARAKDLFLALHPADQAEIFTLLKDTFQDHLIVDLEPAAAADLLEELEDRDALEAVESIPNAQLAGILDQMEPDEAADLLGDLPPALADEVLAQMEDPTEVLPLLVYPDETAGGLMTTAYIALRRNTTAEGAIEFLRQVSPSQDVPDYLFVIDREGRLIGVVGLRDLILAGRAATMSEIMNPEVIHVESDVDQEEAARLMARYDLTALPVVSPERQLLGVITHDDMIDVLESEATEDLYRLAIVGDTDLQPDSSIGVQVRSRLPWLYLSMAAALVAAAVISLFEGLIARIAVLAVFQSVVAGLGGNAVSQNMALVVRAVALGKISAKQVRRVMAKQILVGFLQGLAIGLVVGIGVYLWRGNPALSLVLGISLVANMIVAGIVGTLVPLGLHGLGQDPALASSVLVTAITDSLGFLIFLSLAYTFSSYLV